MDLKLSQPELNPWHPQMRPSAPFICQGKPMQCEWPLLGADGQTEAQLTCGRLQSQCSYCSHCQPQQCAHRFPMPTQLWNLAVSSLWPGTSDSLGPNIPLPP